MMALEAIREIVGFARAWSASVDGGRARDAVRTRDYARDRRSAERDAPTI